MSTEEPKPKKVKTEQEEDSTEEAEQDEASSSLPAMEKNDSGEAFVDLSNMKRLTVRTFKGRVLVDIREVRDCLRACVCVFGIMNGHVS